jgi:hypothetical protein
VRPSPIEAAPARRVSKPPSGKPRWIVAGQQPENGGIYPEELIPAI